MKTIWNKYHVAIIIGGIVLLVVVAYLFATWNNYFLPSAGNNTTGSTGGTIPAPSNTGTTSKGLPSIGSRSATAGINPGIASSSGITNQVTSGTPLTIVSQQTIADTNNNYFIWANGIICYLFKYGNNTIANQLLLQLSAAVATTIAGSAPMYAATYNIDQHPYYNPNFPDMGVYASAGMNSTGRMLSGDGVNVVCTGVTTACTPQSVFHNCYHIMTLVAENVVQAVDQGQAIGSRQSILRSECNNVTPYEGNINIIPAYAAAVIVVYYYANTNIWPSGFGGGTPNNSDVAQITGLVLQVAGVVLLFVPGVGTAVGTGLIAIGTAVGKLPG